MAEATKKCRECLADIPKKARKCSHCGSNQPTSIVTWLVVILVGAVSIIFLAYEPSEPTYTPTPVSAPKTTQVSDFELGTYRVESDEFQYLEVKQVNLWQSYSNRTLVGKVSEGDVVDVTSHDPENDYCKVTTENQTGWVTCGWLVKIK